VSDDPVFLAVEYAKSGQIQAAYETLIGALRRDPRDARAWAVMAAVVDDTEMVRSCLRRVLDLAHDPRLTGWAQHQLDRLPDASR
jgi:Tfp pilus assembly protein PilF